MQVYEVLFCLLNSNIIEHGTSRPLMSSFNDSLETLNFEPIVQTPDETARVADFEERMKFALEQSLILQMKQLVQIDDLQQNIEVLFLYEELKIN